jgi:symplekin
MSGLPELEEQLVEQLDNYRSSPMQLADLKAMQLSPIVDSLAHSAAANARRLGSAAAGNKIQAVVRGYEEHYNTLLVNLAFTTFSELAASDPSPHRRIGALSFFQELYAELTTDNSFLPPNPAADRAVTSGTLALATYQAILRRREIALLRHWTESATNCILGIGDIQADEGMAAKAVISANAVFRPALRCVAASIDAADDRSATEVYQPLLDLTKAVFLKLLNDDQAQSATDNSLRAACIKFTETVVLCFSKRGSTKASSSLDFALEDIPTGHPSITQEGLEAIGEDAFGCLRGWIETGGQIKVTELDSSINQNDEVMLKPALLSFLAADSSDDYSNMQFDWKMNQKEFAIAVNAFAITGSSRTSTFPTVAHTISRLTKDPPKETPGGLTKAGMLSTKSAITASALKLLRSPISVASNTGMTLLGALTDAGLESQAEKAFGVAKQQEKLRNSSRAARNRANLMYTWEDADTVGSKRKQQAEDAIAKIRASKMAKGLGNGIQFPHSMSDMVDLIMLNIEHIEPTDMPLSTTKTLDFLVDAIQSGGRSLMVDESRWYENAGGVSWHVVSDEDNAAADFQYEVDDKAVTSSKDMFADQCKIAAGDAFSRLIASGRQSAKNLALVNFGGNTDEGRKFAARNVPTAANTAVTGAEGGNVKWSADLEELRDSLASRLAWTLKSTLPRGDLAVANALVGKAIEDVAEEEGGEGERAKAMLKMSEEYPLVASCFARDLLAPSISSRDTASLSSRLLYERYAAEFDEKKEDGALPSYDTAVDVLTASVSHLCKVAQGLQKTGQSHLPSEPTRRYIANTAVTQLTKNMSVAPVLSESSLKNLSGIVVAPEAPVEDKTKRTSISERASIRAKNAAADKRAKTTLKALMNVCFKRTSHETRLETVRKAVSIAAGGVPATPATADDAMKLVVNRMFSRSDDLQAMVIEAAEDALEKSAQLAIDKYDEILNANEEKRGEMSDYSEYIDPLAPFSDVEKEVFERTRRAVMLFLALCLHKVELFSKLLQVGSREKADVLNKAIRKELPKFAKSAGKKHGEAETALAVAKTASAQETPLLLALLDNLAPSEANVIPPASLVEACIEIQKTRPIEEGDNAGELDGRYIIPIVSSLERKELTARLPEFLNSGDVIFQAALARMRERLDPYYNKYRDEEESTLLGMSSCEQLVLLHEMDFAAAGLPQRRYLDAIGLLIKDDTVFSDRVLLASLEHMTVKFSKDTSKPLPLAFMRTVNMTIGKHNTLFAYLCNTLLRRLAECKIWEHPRQWEGWMRAASMLAKDESPNSISCILALPQEPLGLFLQKYKSTVGAVVLRALQAGTYSVPPTIYQMFY